MVKPLIVSTFLGVYLPSRVEGLLSLDGVNNNRMILFLQGVCLLIFLASSKYKSLGTGIFAAVLLFYLIPSRQVKTKGRKGLNDSFRA